MKNLLCNLLFVIIYLVPCQARTAQDNIAVIDSLIGEIISHDIRIVADNTTDTLNILNSSTNSGGLTGYSLVIISNHLKQAGWQVFRINDSADARSGLILEVSRVNAEIIYSEPYAVSLLGIDLAQRTIRLRLDGQIRRSLSGEVTKMIAAEHLHRDEIKYNEIEELEGTTFSFTQGERQRYSGWDKFIEPALIVSSVVVIVLLFFTQRA